MATGLLKTGVDLDTLFMARVNAKRADVGILSNGGVDISNRFEPIGAGTPIANVNFKSVGVDIATLFRDINQALGPTVAMPANGYEWLKSNGSPVTLDILNNGTIQYNPISGAVVTHTWLTGGTVAQVDMMITATLGTFTSGTVGSWLNMATTRTYTVAAAVSAQKSVTFTLQFRNASTLAVIGTATGLKLTCDRT